MREFGAHGFSGGSLNVIAREAAVAKGSLFQYFDAKLEMFAYVCEVASERIRAAMEKRMLALDLTRPLFPLLAETLLAWVAYFRTHPLERAVTAATNLEMDDAVREAVRGVANRHYIEVLRPLLERARDCGQLRPDADLDMLLALLLLVLPHLALAPFISGLDPVLGLRGRRGRALEASVTRLVAPLEAAFGWPEGVRP